MLQAEEGIPALRFRQIVSVNRKTLGHGRIASAVSSESEFTLFIPFKAVERKKKKKEKHYLKSDLRSSDREEGEGDSIH